MQFGLGDDQIMIQEAARRFSDERLAPNAARWDEDKHFPLDVIREAASLGFARAETDEPPLLLLVETETQAHCALAVDAVQDQRQVVIKGLESNYGHIPGVSAATVLGDGRIALILDADALASTRPAPPRSGPSAGAPHASL